LAEDFPLLSLALSEGTASVPAGPPQGKHPLDKELEELKAADPALASQVKGRLEGWGSGMAEVPAYHDMTAEQLAVLVEASYPEIAKSLRMYAVDEAELGYQLDDISKNEPVLWSAVADKLDQLYSLGGDEYVKVTPKWVWPALLVGGGLALYFLSTRRG
jgi:hypothetical protein